MFRTIAFSGLTAVLAALALPSGFSLVPSAQAQIGTIFSDPVPRPPAGIPRGNQAAPPDEEEEVPEQLPQGRVLPAPNRTYPGRSSALPGSVQSQPLAPVPGTTVVPQNAPPTIAVAPPQPGAAPPGIPPGQRQPGGTAAAPATLQPGDEVVQEPPAQKII